MRKVKTRLMAVDTGTYTVYRSQTQQSARVGSKNVYIAHSAVNGQLSPVRDSVSLEIYGNRADKMFTLTCEAGADLKLNDRVQYGDDFYTVIAVLSFSGHVSATIEKVGAL